MRQAGRVTGIRAQSARQDGRCSPNRRVIVPQQSLNRLLDDAETVIIAR